MEPVEFSSTSTSKALLPPRVKKSVPVHPTSGRIAASRFLSKPSTRLSSSSPRKAAQKKSFLVGRAGNQAAGPGQGWVDQAAPIDLKGKGKAREADKPYEVPSRFLSASTSTRPSKLSSSSPSKPLAPLLRSSAGYAGRPKPPPLRPPPSTATTRTTKPKPIPPPSNVPPVSAIPLPSAGSASTITTQAPAAEGTRKVSSKISDTSSLGARALPSARGGRTLGQSARGNPLPNRTAVTSVAEEAEPPKPFSWLDLAQSLGSISVPPPPSNPTLHTYAEFLFLLLGQVQLTRVLDEATKDVEVILNEAKQSLAKAEEEVREELERERSGKEIELLDSLLDPKVGHRLIPVLFSLHQAQQTYDSLLLDISSDTSPSHHHSLPLIKSLTETYTRSLATLSTLPFTPGSLLISVLSQLIDRAKDKVAVLRKVKQVVEGRRDLLRKKVWDESVRRGDLP